MQNLVQFWTQTMILGVLDMPDCIVLRWYSCLAMKLSSYKIRFSHHPL